MKNLDFEFLKKEDIPSYKRLIDSVFQNSNDLLTYDNYDSGSELYKILVAKIDKEIVGTVTLYSINLFTFDNFPAVELFNIAVSSEHRGQKIGKRLFEYALNLVKSSGYKSIYVNCNSEATIAHKLYESMGFEKVNAVKYQLNIK